LVQKKTEKEANLNKPFSKPEMKYNNESKSKVLNKNGKIQEKKHFKQSRHSKYNLPFLNKTLEKETNNRDNKRMSVKNNRRSSNIYSIKNNEISKSKFSLIDFQKIDNFNILENDCNPQSNKNKFVETNNLANTSDDNIKINKNCDYSEENKLLELIDEKSITSKLTKINNEFKNCREASNSLNIKKINKNDTFSNLKQIDYNNINNDFTNNSHLVDEIKDYNSNISKNYEFSSLNNYIEIKSNDNKDKTFIFDADFVNKLSALIHDFKHIVYDNMIYFDFLILKYIHPLIISPELCKEKIITNENKLNNEEFNNLKDDLNYLNVMKDFTISLILNITSFMTKNEFLCGNLDEHINLIDIIDLMVKIFNRRLNYDNNFIEKINSSRSSDLDMNANINTNFISNKKSISIYSKFFNKDNISKFKIISNKNLIISLLYNILSNSYKYTDTGEISIEADSYMIDKTEFILIKISDTGKGIPKEILDNWGKPFNFQDKTVGTGLGQFLIDTISKKLKYKILKPEINQFSNSGTVFKILIPIENSSTKNSDNFNQLLNKININTDNNKTINSHDASMLNRSSISQDPNNIKSRNTFMTNLTNHKDFQNTVINTNSLVSSSKSFLDLKNNNSKIYYDLDQKFTIELENLYFDIDEKFRRINLLNNVCSNDLNSSLSYQENESICIKNPNKRKNSKYLEIDSNRILNFNKVYEKNYKISNKNTGKSLILQKDESFPIQNTSISKNEAITNKNKNDYNKSENLKTIHILCLDDELIFLKGLENKLKKIALNFKELRFEFYFTNCIQDFFKIFLDLLFKNIKIQFFIMDQNIAQNMRGIDCCKIANEFYKLYFKDSYAEMNFQFFFVSEEVNLAQFSIMKSKKNLVKKDHIFSKIQLQQLYEKLCEYLELEQSESPITINNNGKNFKK